MKISNRGWKLSAFAALAACAPALAQPANDACANAINLVVPTGGTVSATGNTATATRDGTATCGSSSTTRDVWYRFTVPAAGDLIIDTCSAATTYDSVLSIHSACGGTQIACNDDDNTLCSNNRSRIPLSGRPAGENLWIRVSGFNQANGPFGLNVTHQAAVPPANDNCASATVVNLPSAGSSFTNNSSTLLATADGSGGCTGSGADVWYTVTCGVAGQFNVNTCTGTNFDTVLTVHTACPGSAGNQTFCDDDGCGSSSTITFSATAGQQFLVRVSGSGGATGNFGITMSLINPPVAPNPQIGPDVIVHSLNGMARWGTDAGGTITAYSVGTTSCNPGDYPLLWVDNTSFAPDFDTTQHPAISQNMYRLKTYGTAPNTYQRFEHVGQSWLKHGFVSVNGTECGTCSVPIGHPLPTADSIWRWSLQAYQDVGGEVLGLNCSDPYGASLNGSQGSLGAKNIVNPTLGTSPFVRGNGTGDATIRERLQVLTTDVTGQPSGTRFYVEGQYAAADDAQFVRPGQTVAFNALNNASWREINIQGGTGVPTFITSTFTQQPAIFGWRAADPAVTLVSADHDDTPNPGTGYKNPTTNGPQYPVGTTFARSRFWVAAKVTDIGGGLFRYEYAVYNLNSDRGSNSFSIPYPDAAATPSGFTFRAPTWHSGEPYSNAPWTMTKAAGRLTFSTNQAFNAGNDTANAQRWGTLFNFGFTSDVPPTTGNATIGLFKPAALASIDAVGLPVPTADITPPCPADWNQDGNVDPDDLGDFINCYFSVPPCDRADFNQDTNVDPDDLGDFLNVFFGPPC